MLQQTSGTGVNAIPENFLSCEIYQLELRIINNRWANWKIYSNLYISDILPERENVVYLLNNCYFNIKSNHAF